MHIPGHDDKSKHELDESATPVQFCPPAEGAGLEHNLWRVFVPEPHVTEQ